MRLSRIWRIQQIKEGVIHRGRRPRWITPSEICRILHIQQKPNSIIALLFIQNISQFLKEFHHFALCFSAWTKKRTTSSPGFLSQRFNNLQRTALLTSFRRHRINNLQRAALLTSLVQYYFGQQQLVMVNFACGFNQSETGKYFEWIIISNYWMRLSRIWRILWIKEGVIPRGRRPRWITPSEIIITLLFI